ncbi:unnamed protein product [Cuscuta europaea]|uniref:Uncharacterized protein n=1 Tax=Cuscuta europaea TaxID=41803 RepID=A0A9P0Z1W7_CUSEU|nr:unnamed protein product [Cuscuta europaea]
MVVDHLRRLLDRRQSSPNATIDSPKNRHYSAAKVSPSSTTSACDGVPDLKKGEEAEFDARVSGGFKGRRRYLAIVAGSVVFNEVRSDGCPLLATNKLVDLENSGCWLGLAEEK